MGVLAAVRIPGTTPAPMAPGMAVPGMSFGCPPLRQLVPLVEARLAPSAEGAALSLLPGFPSRRRLSLFHN